MCCVCSLICKILSLIVSLLFIIAVVLIILWATGIIFGKGDEESTKQFREMLYGNSHPKLV